jgi:mannose-1-phosphate guanylyltransferase / mannose-6-phosphate isomerase
MHLWNSGIFSFSTSTILMAFEHHAPETLSLARNAFKNAEADLSFARLTAEPWSRGEDISIDYAIMENAPNVSVVPCGGVWSDLGDWRAIWRESAADIEVVVAVGLSTALDCKNMLLRAASQTQQLVAMGLEDIIVVAMPDAFLVVHKDRAQDVKVAVNKLREKGVTQVETLSRDYRPWGWFESIALEARFQVKRIMVNPGAALSLQSHDYRSEYWIVVDGNAKVAVDDEAKIVAENKSVYVPLGTVHRIENPGKSHLTLLEVQTCSYFGEDDIIRHEDVYARR